MGNQCGATGFLKFERVEGAQQLLQVTLADPGLPGMGQGCRRADLLDDGLGDFIVARHEDIQNALQQLFAQRG
ncbi:hypothetical protein D3C71_2000880 [compost metagenome]